MKYNSCGIFLMNSKNFKFKDISEMIIVVAADDHDDQQKGLFLQPDLHLSFFLLGQDA